jgi:isoaspartyl peptidase/L-asparaginase-like protein (Ntn-hydrolase superfamily)
LISEEKFKKWSSKKKKDTTDTIGSIMIYKNEEQGIPTMIIATSSGGPWLKMPGRVGSVKLHNR